MNAIIRTHTTAVTWEEIAETIADAPSSAQQKFLQLLSNTIEENMPNASWAFQCRYITDHSGWDENVRKNLIWQLETLVDHLKDPAPKA